MTTCAVISSVKSNTHLVVVKQTSVTGDAPAYQIVTLNPGETTTMWCHSGANVLVEEGAAVTIKNDSVNETV